MPSEHQETVSTVRVTQHWYRSPREVVESASLDIVKSHLDKILGNEFQRPCMNCGVGLDNLQRCWPTSAILRTSDMSLTKKRNFQKHVLKANWQFLC